MKKNWFWLSGRFNRPASSREGDSQTNPKTSGAVHSHGQQLQYTTALSTPQLTLRQTLRAAWSMSKPYFTESPEKSRGKMLVGGVVGLSLGQVGLAIWLNTWRGGFWDAM